MILLGFEFQDVLQLHCEYHEAKECGQTQDEVTYENLDSLQLQCEHHEAKAGDHALDSEVLIVLAFESLLSLLFIAVIFLFVCIMK